MATKKNIGSYLGEESSRYFRIPAYQRGYKWGISNSEEKNNAAILIDDILSALKAGKLEYFIQGVTVYEKEKEIVLIDGQQRTTTIFLILNELLCKEEKAKYLFFDGNFKLVYDIRTSSNEYLKKICSEDESSEQNTQDIYSFKKAQEQIKSSIDCFIKDNRQYNIDSVKNYILDHVMLFYIKVKEEQASAVFSMLNGAKAFMKTDELIKADFLCKVSNSDNIKKETVQTSSIEQTMDILKAQLKEETAREWECNSIRSRYAREWDKWLYWWNRPDVKAFFGCGNNPMGLLLEYYYSQDHFVKGEKCVNNVENKIKYSNKAEDVSSVFKSFQNICIKDSQNAKLNFEELRKLQKKFENIYSRPHFYNYLGLTLLCCTGDKKEIIRYYLANFKDKEKTQRYSLLRIAGLTNKEILDNNKDAISEKCKEMISSISQKFVYSDEVGKENAFKQLFRLNVEAANEKKSKFEFFYLEKDNLVNFYEYRSLEHIWPKSKVVFKQEGESIYKTIGFNKNNLENDELKIEVSETDIENYIKRENLENKEITEHCIGNLVFLHKTDNSKFNAKVPEDKKKVYFKLDEKIYSRCLLHTMSVFAFDNWSKEFAINNIKENQEKTIELIKTKYNVYTT